MPPPTLGATPPLHDAAVLAVAGGCAGGTVPSSYTGSLAYDGGPMAGQAAANVSLNYAFSIQWTVRNESSGATVSASCTSSDGTLATGSNGSIKFSLSGWPTGCILNPPHTLCTSASGPYGPVSLSTGSDAPAGYELRSSLTGSAVRATLVAELGGVNLVPGGPRATFSPGATDAVQAVAEAADGTPTPLAPLFDWRLTGVGWAFDSQGDGPTVTLMAAPGAATGVLSVTAQATVDGREFTGGPTTIDLVAVSTRLTAVVANRTVLDAGGSVNFSLYGTGAEGYAYTAHLTPGLGLDGVGLPCRSDRPISGTVDVTCTGSVLYPLAGTATPAVALSNGYSGDSRALPDLTIAPPLALSVAPDRPAGYAGAPLPVHVAAAPGSGTSPFLEACLDPGFGATLCSSSPGPNWSFSPTYAAPGDYTARTWVRDGSGTTSTVTFSIEVVNPLTAPSVTALPAHVTAQSVVALSASWSGGLLPDRFWWNVSGSSIPLADGVWTGTGPIQSDWLPTAAGDYLLTLTVVDALGSSTVARVVATVDAPLASAIAVLVGPPAGPTIAGAPVPLEWGAVDAQGTVVRGFAGPTQLTVRGPGPGDDRPIWINSTAVGALASADGVTYDIPAAAWQLGTLALTVTVASSGTWSLVLAGVGPLALGVFLVVPVAADATHLRITDPTVLLPGTRTNHTYWEVGDRFGNPAPGASLELRFQGATDSLVSWIPVVADGAGGSGAWVNFTAPGSGGGTLELLDAAGDRLLGPTSVPSAGPAPLTATVVTAVTVGPIGAVGLGVVAWVRRRDRRARQSSEGPEVDEEELQRFVAGRDRVVSIVRDASVIGLSGIDQAWGEGGAPSVLSDWVASLVADGTLGARTGPDGIARFCLGASAAGPPIVLVDESARDRAVERQRALAAGEDLDGDLD